MADPTGGDTVTPDPDETVERARDFVDIGPWRTERTYWKRTPDRWTFDVLDEAGVIASVPSAADDPDAERLARLIAAAPTLVADLLAIIDTQAGELNELKERTNDSD